MKRQILALAMAAGILWAFLLGLGNLDQSRKEQGRLLLEQAVRNAAVACYADQGAYPPDIAYLQAHYGLQYDEEHYILHYQLEASNLMPEITVLEK